MYINHRISRPLLAGFLSTAALIAGAAQAETRAPAPGYAADSVGNIVRSGTGECWRVGSFQPQDANVVGCEGVVLEVDVEVIEGAGSGLVSFVNIPAAALFAFDNAELSAEGKDAIEEYRKELRPELAEAYAGIIIGHTDSVGDADYNMGLSLRRAEAVRDYLVGTGVPAEKLRVLGRGKNEPIASNDTQAGRALNRRVEIAVIGEARALDTMRFPSVALFPRRSAEITAQGKQLIEKNRRDALEMLRRASYIEIIGHTDDDGDDDYNQELSEQRAEAMRDYLVSTGTDASKIVTWGAGETMPITTNQTAEGRAENRRVEILVLGRLK